MNARVKLIIIFQEAERKSKGDLGKDACSKYRGLKGEGQEEGGQ